MGLYDTVFGQRIEHEEFEKNMFVTSREGSSFVHVDIPDWGLFYSRLPHIRFTGCSELVEAYEKAWSIAYSNIKTPTAGEHEVVTYPMIDTAFNDCIFLWDSAFISLYSLYSRGSYDLSKALYCFYGTQHPNGYICREIRRHDGLETFDMYDPSGTGPNILAWVEYMIYEQTNDLERLSKVYPVLKAYDDYYYDSRSWKDGSCFSTGWGSGMDNQPRQQEGAVPEISHGHMSWIDITSQQVLSWMSLSEIARVLGDIEGSQSYTDKARSLKDFINSNMWNEKLGFYVDLYRDGTLSDVKSIGAFWVLLADIPDADRTQRVVAHLLNENSFGTRFPFPSLSVDHPDFSPEGDYWCGSVWSPTAIMVLKGLERAGYEELSATLAMSHVDHIVGTYLATGTFWENYSPVDYKKGNHAKSDFIGWTGLSIISILIEFVLGIRIEAHKNMLTWTIKELAEQGIERLPFAGGTVSLLCKRRESSTDEPDLEVCSDIPLTIRVRWEGGEKCIET